MSLRREILPTDPEQLVELVLELAEENERLRAALKTINTLHFGAKSERIRAITKQQMALDLADLADLVTDASPPPANDDQPEATKAAPRRPRQPAHRNVGSLAKHRPRCERVIEPDSAICPCCACQMRRIGESVHAALDVVPAILRVLRTIRRAGHLRAVRLALSADRRDQARINSGDTEDYAAIAGVAEHHNAISATLSDAPQRFVPIFERDAKGAVDVTSALQIGIVLASVSVVTRIRSIAVLGGALGVVATGLALLVVAGVV
jgi:hypothetical protein